MAATSTQSLGAQEYTVEVLVFSQSGGDGESWIDPDSVYIPDNLPLSTAISTADLNHGVFRPASNESLSAAAEQLDRSGNYTLLLQESWDQSTDVQEKTAKYRIEKSLGDDKLLTGYLHVFLTGVYLQIDLRLILVDFGVPREFRYSPVPTYQIDEVRRIKLNEVHYMDHPRLGALVTVGRAGS